MSAKEFCRSDSERGSLSSLEIDVRAAEYSTRDSVTSLHYRSLQSQPPPPPVPVQVDAPVRPKHLQCSTIDVPTTRKRFHTAPREKHRVSKSLHARARNVGVPESYLGFCWRFFFFFLYLSVSMTVEDGPKEFKCFFFYSRQPIQSSYCIIDFLSYIYIYILHSFGNFAAIPEIICYTTARVYDIVLQIKKKFNILVLFDRSSTL